MRFPIEMAIWRYTSIVGQTHGETMAAVPSHLLPRNLVKFFVVRAFLGSLITQLTQLIEHILTTMAT